MTNPAKPYNNKHRQSIARIETKTAVLETLFSKFKKWIIELPQKPPRTPNDWKAAGFTAFVLLSEGLEVILEIRKELQTVKEIMRDAPK